MSKEKNFKCPYGHISRLAPRWLLSRTLQIYLGGFIIQLSWNSLKPLCRFSSTIWQRELEGGISIFVSYVWEHKAQSSGVPSFIMSGTHVKNATWLLLFLWQPKCFACKETQPTKLLELCHLYIFSKLWLESQALNYRQIWIWNFLQIIRWYYWLWTLRIVSSKNIYWAAPKVFNFLCAKYSVEISKFL